MPPPDVLQDVLAGTTFSPYPLSSLSVPQLILLRVVKRVVRSTDFIFIYNRLLKSLLLSGIFIVFKTFILHPHRNFFFCGGNDAQASSQITSHKD